MSLPRNLGAYRDCIEYFERAPIRVAFDTRGAAMQFKMRMHNARALLRDENTRIFGNSDPRSAASEFDRFKVAEPIDDPDGLWWVYIEEWKSTPVTSEPL